MLQFGGPSPSPGEELWYGPSLWLLAGVCPLLSNGNCCTPNLAASDRCRVSKTKQLGPQSSHRLEGVGTQWGGAERMAPACSCPPVKLNGLGSSITGPRLAFIRAGKLIKKVSQCCTLFNLTIIKHVHLPNKYCLQFPLLLNWKNSQLPVHIMIYYHLHCYHSYVTSEVK